jgi:hypothetical protein
LKNEHNVTLKKYFRYKLKIRYHEKLIE